MSAVWPYLLGMLGGIVAGAVAWFRAPSQNTRDKAEAENVTGDTYRDLIGALRVEVSELRTEVSEVRGALATVTCERDRLRRENDDLLARVTDLEEHVSELASRRPPSP